MLDKAEVRLNTDFLTDKDTWLSAADTVVYTGMIDEYFGYTLGPLEYRSLRFETETIQKENYQGNAVVNYTSCKVPYTRIIEHKHFEQNQSPVTVITKEYPAEWKKGDEPYYPVNNSRNAQLFSKYQELAEGENKIHPSYRVIFGGRLGMYKYFDMDDTIAAALELAEKII